MHQNKNKNPKPTPQNREEIKFDAMPREVATEMLLGGNLSNRQRKECNRARSKMFASTLRPKASEEILNGKFQAATWSQLCKWGHRVVAHRDDVQRAYVLATRQRNTALQTPVDKKQPAHLSRLQVKIAVLDRVIADLNLKAAKLDIFRDCLESEIDRRQDFIAQLHGISEGVAAAVEKNLCPA